MARRNNDRPLTRDIILEEAIVLFAEHGYRHTSLERIATRLSVTRQALYYYFKSKSDILLAIQQQAMDRLEFSASQIFRMADLSDRERFDRLIENHATLVCREAKRISILYREESGLPRKALREIRDRRRRYNAEFEELYGRCARSGDFVEVDPTLASYFVIGAANWMARWYRAEHGTPEEMGHELQAFLSGGYDKQARGYSASEPRTVTRSS